MSDSDDQKTYVWTLSIEKLYALMPMDPSRSCDPCYIEDRAFTVSQAFLLGHQQGVGRVELILCTDHALDVAEILEGTRISALQKLKEK